MLRSSSHILILAAMQVFILVDLVLVHSRFSLEVVLLLHLLLHLLDLYILLLLPIGEGVLLVYEHIVVVVLLFLKPSQQDIACQM